MSLQDSRSSIHPSTPLGVFLCGISVCVAICDLSTFYSAIPARYCACGCITLDIPFLTPFACIFPSEHTVCCCKKRYSCTLRIYVNIRLAYVVGAIGPYSFSLCIGKESINSIYFVENSINQTGKKTHIEWMQVSGR